MLVLKATLGRCAWGGPCAVELDMLSSFLAISSPFSPVFGPGFDRHH